jgi:HSP20 family molecular chaperone IbpA
MLAPFFGFRGMLDNFDNCAPHAQVRETSSDALLEMEVPRFRAEDIRVDRNLQTGLITVTGSRQKMMEEDLQARDVDLFGTLVWSTCPLTRFQKQFHLSPQHYDLSKLESHVAHGVLMIKIPKLAQPQQIAGEPQHQQLQLQNQQAPQQPVTIFGGKAHSTDVVAKTTPQEFEALRHARWPPTIKVEQKPDAMVYRCELPPTVTADHIDLQMAGRSLTLSINYERHSMSDTSEESQQMTYSTGLTVPEGTMPEDVHTAFENGCLTVELAKHANTNPRTERTRQDVSVKGAKKSRHH